MTSLYIIIDRKRGIIMKKNFFLHSLPFRLLVGVAFGICIGLLLNIIDESAITTAVLNVVVTSKYILGQLISFSVPLIIIGFIAPSITRLGNNASRMLGVAVSIAYASSLGAALFSALSGYLLIPHLSFSSTASHLKALPDVVFELSSPQIMPVMSALVLAIMLALILVYTFVTQRMVIGRQVYAVGGNAKAAALSGIKTKKVMFWVYANMGLLAALAGVVLSARNASATPKAGDGFELDAIASCYIGGASAYGGTGTVVGAVIGALIMGILNNGMSLIGWSVDIQRVIKGLVLLGAVTIDLLSKKRK